ncbi:acetylornithine deacetylase [Kushneria aurantia]|uniref:Acetylornithine deacetylase n=1 Tax=Kushneria aurantia TaxID=504092 RepID=A0ABV6FZS3_9GAMM|nr:acetylornithine deacetylase [Kushneria aurantia]
MTAPAPAGTPDSAELLAELIAFDTTSHRSNLALIGFIEAYLAGQGVKTQRIPDASGEKANLFATIGPAEASGILLSGHTDTVPVEGQPWQRPPYCLTREGDRFYGRGTADMKGFLACVLAAVPRFVNAPLQRPIHLAFSCDEEVGCVGVRSMIERLPSLAPASLACIVGEPTGMRPVMGHKGKLARRCHIRGAACHSAYAPQGVNAIEYAAALIGRLVAVAERLQQQDEQDARFTPPFSTLQVGTIQGGRALNIVPDECSFDWEMRALPGVEPQVIEHELRDWAERELLPRMQAVAPGARIDFEPLAEYPGLAADAEGAAARLLAELTGCCAFDTVAFGTEAGLYAEAGVPTLVCGPGSMAQGHKADEYIEAEQLEACDAMMARLAARLSSSAT